MAFRSKHRPGVLSAFTHVKMFPTSHHAMRSTRFPITLEPQQSPESSLHQLHINLIYASGSNEPLTLMLDGLHSSQNAPVEFAYLHVAPCPTPLETAHKDLAATYLLTITGDPCRQVVALVTLPIDTMLQAPAPTTFNPSTAIDQRIHIPPAGSHNQILTMVQALMALVVVPASDMSDLQTQKQRSCH